MRTSNPDGALATITASIIFVTLVILGLCAWMFLVIHG